MYFIVTTLQSVGRWTFQSLVYKAVRLKGCGLSNALMLSVLLCFVLVTVTCQE